jgi:DNA-3-methyladenine glycosylase II
MNNIRFHSETDFHLACTLLAGSDSVLAGIIRQFGLPRAPLRAPGFATLVRIILEQQVSLAAAATVYARLEDGIGAITPGNLSTREIADLRACGLTNGKSGYIIGLAQAVVSDGLVLDRFSEGLRERLITQRGIGPWTADIYLMMGLGLRDIWPAGDLALNKALIDLYGYPENELTERIAGWKPNRTAVAALLWHHYLSQPR